MKHLSEFNALEALIHMTLDGFSNGEPVPVKDEWIEEAAEDFKNALQRQLQPKPRTFGLRASNIGRPLCQLQQENAGTPQSPNAYNHIIRMLHGDAIEVIMTLVLKAANVKLTGGKEKHEFVVNGQVIKGEDDVQIDGKVWDIKSCSAYAFQHKWGGGWESLFTTDTFGYVEQLFVYAGGDVSRMGGWIVVDKSSGEVKIVEAKPTKEQLQVIKARIETNEKAVRENVEFFRQFEPEPEFHYKKPTGNLLVPKTCTFCNFQKACWPNARLLAKTESKAENPRQVWYTFVKDDK